MRKNICRGNMSESWLMDDVLQAVKGQLGAFGDLGTDTAIRDCLMLSYTDLGRRDPKLQTMFLDTAWMMLGRDREEADWIFEGTCSTTGGSPRIDLQTLIDLSLVDCDAHGCLSMHDALTDMAQHIISQPGTIPKYQIVCNKDIQVSVEMSQNKLNRMDAFDPTRLQWSPCGRVNLLGVSAGQSRGYSLACAIFRGPSYSDRCFRQYASSGNC